MVWVMTTKDAELQGQIIAGTYRIVELLGAGGMGSVYKAVNIPLDKTVAIKMVHNHLLGGTASNKQRLLREARVLGGLKHPNILSVEAVTVDGTDLLVVMELLEGIDLGEFLKRSGKLSLPAFQSIFKQVCDGLAYAHSKNIIHRDLKPSNIVLTGDTSGDASQCIAKIVDFGLAKLIDSEAQQKLTATGSLLGTPNYMSPEQCQGGTLSPSSDIYSLACVMHQCLSGDIPFETDTPMATIFRHGTETLPPLQSNELAAVSSILQRCTAVDPADRLQTPNALWQALEANDVLPAVERSHQTPRRETKQKYLVSVLVASLVAAAAALSWFFQRPTSAPTTPTEMSFAQTQMILDRDVQHMKRALNPSEIDIQDLLSRLRKQFRKAHEYNDQRELALWHGEVATLLVRHPDELARDKATIELATTALNSTKDEGNRVQVLEDCLQLQMSPDSIPMRCALFDSELQHIAELKASDNEPLSLQTKMLDTLKARLQIAKATMLSTFDLIQARKLILAPMKTLLSNIDGQPITVSGNALHKAWSGYKTMAGLANEDRRFRRQAIPVMIAFKSALQAELAKDDVSALDQQYYPDWIAEIDKTLSRY
jgi:serine/threonine protein kinase